MNGDRDETRGGWNVPPVDDQSDAEPELTGEFTIDYTPPAWYTQNTPGSTSGGGAPGSSGLASPPPPAGTPVAVPGLPAGSGFEPHWTPAPAPAPDPAADPAWPADPGPAAAEAPRVNQAEATPPAAPEPFGGGDIESGSTMRFSPAALKQEIARHEKAGATAATGAPETAHAPSEPEQSDTDGKDSAEGSEGAAIAEPTAEADGVDDTDGADEAEAPAVPDAEAETGPEAHAGVSDGMPGDGEAAAGTGAADDQESADAQPFDFDAFADPAPQEHIENLAHAVNRVTTAMQLI